MKIQHLIPILFLAGFCTVSVSLFCCGCRSVALSPKETQDIKDFAQKQTGEPVVSMVRQADGDVQLTTDMTNGITSYHTWLLLQELDGWKLTLLATTTTSSTNSVLNINQPSTWDVNRHIWVYTWDAKKRLWRAVMLTNGKSPLKLRPQDMTIN